MKKSKVDAIIKRKLAEAQAAAEARRVSDVAYAKKSERDRYELQVLPPDDGTGVCVLGPVPEHLVMYVAVHPRYSPRVADPAQLDRHMMMDCEFRRATFEVVQKCQSFGNGQRVISYEYQFRGIS